MRRSSPARPLTLALVPAFLFAAATCGGRSELLIGDPNPSSPGGGGRAGAGGVAGQGGSGGGGGEMPCQPGEVLACGSDVGECSPGTRSCVDGLFGPCDGAVVPIDELCNDLDDDCDGQIDNGFGLGLPCDGPDSDLCTDDVVICGGCSSGDDTLESCNGVDDNCNGIIDSDCDFGDCQPQLLVTGSTPSDPNCVDFPVEAGSEGGIQYPCAGGPVSAQLGSINFTGSVTNGQVLLTGTQQQIGPDGCLWQMDHTIEGYIPSGTLQYSYAELLLDNFPWCWSPCTEVGTVEITW